MVSVVEEEEVSEFSEARARTAYVKECIHDFPLGGVEKVSTAVRTYEKDGRPIFETRVRTDSWENGQHVVRRLRFKLNLKTAFMLQNPRSKPTAILVWNPVKAKELS
jgi:hypothetical protein